jgi:hypothetical protein
MQSQGLTTFSGKIPVSARDAESTFCTESCLGIWSKSLCRFIVFRPSIRSTGEDSKIIAVISTNTVLFRVSQKQKFEDLLT